MTITIERLIELFASPPTVPVLSYECPPEAHPTNVVVHSPGDPPDLHPPPPLRDHSFTLTESVSHPSGFIRLIFFFSPEKVDKNFLEILVVYSFTVTNLSEKIISKSIIERIPKPIKDKVMTTYDRILNKGIEKGVSKQRT